MHSSTSHKRFGCLFSCLFPEHSGLVSGSRKWSFSFIRLNDSNLVLSYMTSEIVTYQCMYIHLYEEWLAYL